MKREEIIKAVKAYHSAAFPAKAFNREKDTVRYAGRVFDENELAALVDRSLRRRVDLAPRGVKQAGFYVLRGTDAPALLIEMAFLSAVVMPDCTWKVIRFLAGLG